MASSSAMRPPSPAPESSDPSIRSGVEEMGLLGTVRRCVGRLVDEVVMAEESERELEALGYRFRFRTKPKKAPQKPAWADAGISEDAGKAVGGSVCVFFTKSPFGETAHSPFYCQGKHYASLDHYFQIQMLYSFGMFRLAMKLLEIEDGHNFRKSLRANLKTMVKSGLFDEKMFAKWRKANVGKMMRQGCRAKFEQHWGLKRQLLATGDRLLVYAAKNDFLLGVGMSEGEFLAWVDQNNVSIEDLLDMFTGNKERPKVLGANHLGLALMDVRADAAACLPLLTEWKLLRHAQLNASLGQAATEELDDQPADAREESSADPAEPKPSEAPSTSDEPVIFGSAVPLPLPQVLVAPEEITVESAKWETPEQEKQKKAERATGLSVDRMLIQQRAGFLGLPTEPPSEEPAEPPKEAEPDVEIITVEDGTSAVKMAGEKRILISKASAVEAAADQEEARQQRQKRLDFVASAPPDQTSAAPAPKPNTAAQNLSVLERLRRLMIQRPMVNPFSYSGDRPETTSDISILGEGQTDKAVVEGEEEDFTGLRNHRSMYATDSRETQRLAYLRARDGEEPEAPAVPRPLAEKVQLWCKGMAPLYALEPGEICPPGLTPMTPEEQKKVAEGKLSAGPRSVKRRAPVVHLPLGTQSRPAALPNHLLHHLPKAGQIPDSVVFAPDKGSISYFDSAHEMQFKQPYLLCEPLLERAERISNTKMEPWRPPTDPIGEAIAAAKNLPTELFRRKMALMEAERRRKEAILQRQHRQLFGSVDEGATPASRQRNLRKLEELEMNMGLGLEADIFSFGTTATLEDLQILGYVPPPIASITGDTQSNARNTGHSKSHWLVGFESAEEALKFHQERWRKGGRLGVTGKLEAAEDSEDEEDIDELLANFASSSEEDSDAEDMPAMNSMGVVALDEQGAVKKRRRRPKVQTQIVFQDTSLYRDYVRWYQHVHGISAAASQSMEELDVEELRGWFHHYTAFLRPVYEIDWDEAEAGPTRSDAFVSSEDAWILSRWQAANAEARQPSALQDHRHLIDAAAQLRDDGVSYSARPVAYEFVYEPDQQKGRKRFKKDAYELYVHDDDAKAQAERRDENADETEGSVTDVNID